MKNIENLEPTEKNIHKYKNMLMWGTFGKKGNIPLRWVLLKDRSISHLRAILKTQHQITPFYRECIKSIIEDKVNELFSKKPRLSTVFAKDALINACTTNFKC